jgi:hypothetical protein
MLPSQATQETLTNFIKSHCTVHSFIADFEHPDSYFIKLLFAACVSRHNNFVVIIYIRRLDYFMNSNTVFVVSIQFYGGSNGKSYEKQKRAGRIILTGKLFARVHVEPHHDR